MFSMFLRTIVALTAVLFSCFVADSLLRLTEEAAEIIVPGEDWEKLADEDVPPSPPSPPLEEPEEVSAAEAAAGGPTESDPRSPSDGRPESKVVADDSPRAVPIPEKSVEASHGLRLPLPETEARTEAMSEKTGDRSSGVETTTKVAERRLESNESTDGATNAAGSPPGVLPQFGMVEAGQLASFGGASANEVEVAGGPGEGRRPVWDVRLSGLETSRHVSFPPGFVLVAVRVHGMDVELVPLGSPLPPTPLTQDEFVKRYPAHVSRQGIRLSSASLGPWREKLLNYDVQGGWQAWLLVDARTHGQWLQRLDDEIRAHGRTWEELAKVASSIDLRRINNRTSVSLRIEKLHWKD